MISLLNTLAALSTHLTSRCAIPSRLPNSGGDMLLGIVLGCIVIDGDQLAVWPLNRAGVTEIIVAAINPQRQFLTPCLSVILTYLGPNPIGEER